MIETIERDKLASPLVTETADLLMCAPSEYDLKYEINPWMSLTNRPDRGVATSQWNALYRILRDEIGLRIALIPQALDAPDMVFTANAGLVRGDAVMMARFRHPERQVEEPFLRSWFAEQGYRLHEPPAGTHFEGEGDALFAGGRLVAGYLKRSDMASHGRLSQVFDIETLSVELVDDRWYHLDTCFTPLGGDLVAYYPGAFDRYGRDVIEANFETIEVDLEEALHFANNAVVSDSKAVLPTGCPRFEQALVARGFSVYSVEMSEFLKAGGAAKCLVLYLN